MTNKYDQRRLLVKPLLVISTLLRLGLLCLAFPSEDDTRAKRSFCNNQNQLDPSYSYIVVGGGVAGCIVASRLSENPHNTVLLLEAGSDVKALNNLFPFFIPSLTEQPKVDYNLTTVPQQKICLSTGGICEQPRGFKLGGCSFVTLRRGNVRDFNFWSSLGNPSWDFSSVLPFFQKYERYIADDGDGGSIGRNGPIPVNNSPNYWLTPYIFQAFNKDMNLPRTNLFDGTSGGVQLAKSNLEQGEIRSPVDNYLRPALNRPNLCVRTEAFVTGIVINGTTNLRAEGVNFTYRDKYYSVGASRSVILSAGVFGSPQLLMLSGIGPADHLSRVGIPVKKNLPGVGENLHDHPRLVLEFNMTNVAGTENCSEATAEYIFNRTGIYALPDERRLLVTSQTNTSFTSFDYPDTIVTVGGARQADVLRIFGTLAQVKSRGNVRLRSSSPFADPVIDPNYFSSEEDFCRMRQMVDFQFRLANTPTLGLLGVSLASFRHDLYPSCPANSTDFYGCLIMNYGQSSSHQVGTCKMSPSTDPMAVVDSQLRVHGVHKLHVIDASIMPRVPNHPIAGAVMMIAEKGAHMIQHSDPNTPC